MLRTFIAGLAGFAGLGGLYVGYLQHQAAAEARADAQEQAELKIQADNTALEHMEQCRNLNEQLATVNTELQKATAQRSGSTAKVRSVLQASTKLQRATAQTLSRLVGVLVAEIEVAAEPLPGQSWRCSKNFFVRSSAQQLVWVVEDVNASNITFSIKQDVRLGRDKTVYKALKSKDSTSLPGDVPIYVGGVRGAKALFKIKVYGRSSK